MRVFASLLCVLFTLSVRAVDPPPSPFLEVADATIPAPPADQAQIVFLEPINKIQGISPAGIFVIKNWQAKTPAEIAELTLDEGDAVPL
jgi:hypothetical protein